MRLTLAWTLVVAAFAALPATAGAEDLLSGRVAVSKAVPRDCVERALDGASGTASRTVTVPAAGWVSAHLDGGAGDWDLGLFDADSGRPVAGSASFGRSEVAEGIAGAGERVVVQACRRSGEATGADLAVTTTPVPKSDPESPPQLVSVSTPNEARKNDLTSLGVDVAESGGPGWLAVLLHGRDDADLLRRHGFSYTVTVPDVAAQDARDRAADDRFARDVPASDFPSGRTTYRHLADYGMDMKRLVDENPGVVRPIVLPYRTWTGREVDGIEIALDVNARDGRPVLGMMGVHHAREWPAGEHTIEFGIDLVDRLRAGDAHVRDLLGAARVVIVPIVNPDGFSLSREAGPDGGRAPDDFTLPFEYQRKNCRLVDDSTAGACMQAGQPSLAGKQPGVDPNRNYGAFWGGAGAGLDPLAADYRGPGPFSEPESRNIEDLVSHRQVVTLISNHTWSDLILRSPGVRDLAPTPDDATLVALGDEMAAKNGYTSQPGYGLYDTTGGSDDWAYYETAALAYTLEIGCDVPAEPDGSCKKGNFHPPYAEMVAEYDGTSARAAGRGGNRAAYIAALESTANPARHSVIEGNAPAGTVLRLHKSFTSPTSRVRLANGLEAPPRTFDDTLDTTMVVPASGRFDWNVNPSTRPLVARSSGRAPTGPVSPEVTFATDAGGGTTPCQDDETPACYSDSALTVPGDAGADNARMLVRAEWASAADDWDMRVYRSVDGSGTIKPGDPVVGSSDQADTTFEQATVASPKAGDVYVVRVVNYQATGTYNGRTTFEGPEPFEAAKTEAWTLTCEAPEGTVRSTQQVVVGRGEAQSVDLSACAGGSAAAGGGAAPAGENPIPGLGPSASRCLAFDGGIAGRTLGPARLGRTRAQQSRVLAVGPTGRRAGDRYCIDGGGSLRVGYANDRLARAARTARAVLILTTSKRVAAGGLRPGARVAAKRLRGTKRIRIGRTQAWYVRKGRAASSIVRVRGKRVVEVGIVTPRFARGRAGLRLARAFG